MSRTEVDRDHDEEAEAGSRPLLTVLMPTYNGRRFVREQVESILAQDYGAIRLSILDDGSTDGTVDILSSMAERDPRIDLRVNPANEGLISTISTLLASVRTPLFALSDQDDVWDADKLSVSVARLHTADASLVYSDVRTCDSDGNVADPAYWTARGIRPVAGRDPVPFVFRNPAVGHTIVSTREVASRASHMPPYLRFHEAWIIAVACQLGHVDYVERQLGSYRFHDANVVGPKQTGGRRIAGILLGRGRLRLRQATRAAALSALSDLDPSLRRVSSRYRRGLVGRVRGLPTVIRFLRSRATSIGLGPTFAEVVLYVAFGAGDLPRTVGTGSRS